MRDDFEAGAGAVLAILLILALGFIAGMATTSALIKIPTPEPPTWEAICIGKLLD